MAELSESVRKRIAEELIHVGDFGRVTLIVTNGLVSRVEGTRSTMFVDERQPELLLERSR